MSALAAHLQAILRFIWPFGRIGATQWVEPSNAITRAVLTDKRQRPRRAAHKTQPVAAQISVKVPPAQRAARPQAPAARPAARQPVHERSGAKRPAVPHPAPEAPAAQRTTDEPQTEERRKGTAA